MQIAANSNVKRTTLTMIQHRRLLPVDIDDSMIVERMAASETRQRLSHSLKTGNLQANGATQPQLGGQPVSSLLGAGRSLAQPNLR